MNRADVYERVTRGILERLETGVAPWHQPWAVAGGRPRNFATGRPYSGVNALALGLTGRSPYWMTIYQVNRMGFRVRRGSKGVPIIYVEPRTTRERNAAGEEVEREHTIVRVHYVFNAEDVDGLKLPEPEPRNAGQGIPAAEAILAGVRPVPDIRTGTAAYFAPGLDQVVLPPKASFHTEEDYYATAFHELTHWSGHPSRLNRETMATAAPFGSPVYSQEELVAEMGAGLLCALAGIENKTLDQSASYLAHWLKVLRGEPGMLVRAARQAQRVVDFLVPPDRESPAPTDESQKDAGPREAP